MSIKRFKEILNEILLATADIKQSAGVEFSGDAISRMAIAVYLQESRENENMQSQSKIDEKKIDKKKTKRQATKKQIKALKKIYGSLQKVRELAGVDSLYDLDVATASQLITKGNNRHS